MPPVLPVAEYAPDRPDLAECTNIALNVIALTAESFGPFPTFVPYTDNAIDDDCVGMGMGFAESTDNVHHIFAGTDAKLWSITGTSTSWANVSGATYGTGSEDWRFAQFKNLMLATNYNDPIQSYDMIAGGTFGVLSPDAPNARYIAVAKDFVIVANTNDPVGGKNPARLWWSANNDPTWWPVLGSADAQTQQSDYNDMEGPMGQITGLVPNLSGCDCGVFFERGVFRMIYSGPPDIFNFYPAATVRGCNAPNSIVPLGGLVYYLGEDGFYVFDGTMSVPIGANKVDKFFFANLDPTAYNSVIGAPDVANKAIVWMWRTLYAPDQHPDRALIFRWDIQRWSIAIVHAEWISRVPVSQTGVVAPSSAGQLQLAGIHNGQLGFFSGEPMPAQVGTKVVQLVPGMRAFVSGTRPLVKIGGPFGFLLTEDGRDIITESGLALLCEVPREIGLYILTEDGLRLLAENGSPLLTEAEAGPQTVTVAMSARNTYYETEIFGPESMPDISGECPTRSNGRYHRGRVTIPAGIWTDFAGLDVVAIKAGVR